LALALAGPAAADYPDKPIKIVVPFAPGGTVDVSARIIGARLTELWKQPVIVENRVGAGQTIGTNFVAKSPPDGYTLLLALESIAVSPSVFANLPYDPVKDFDPVTLINRTQWIMVAKPALPAKTMPEMIAYARQNPGKLNYGSSGNGGSAHLATEAMLRANGLTMTHIPYQGGAPAITAMLGGQVDIMLSVGTLAAPHIRAGTLKGLAMTGQVRASAFPDLPTMKEQGIAGFDSGDWTGMFAPKGTPREIIVRLNGEVRKLIESVRSAGPEGKFYLQDFQVPEGSTPEEMAAILRRDVEKWRRITQEIGFKPQ
jgi:tripartite-type tricarboxylate transporter receptor subunit TctC